MSVRGTSTSEMRFKAYLNGPASIILMACGGRKRVEPMAVTAPARTAAQHQSVPHFVGDGAWSDEKVLGKIPEMVLPAIKRQGSHRSRIINDTGFPNRGDIRLELHGNIAATRQAA
ncbi:SRSO17 transposase [Bradyrhizobium sp. USDA 4354]